MNINAFTTGNTNIFPMANSKAGGQLATEFNLLCRETVATDPDVSYSIGHSFTHSMDDFAVTKAPIDSRDGNTDNAARSSTVLVVSSGRAIVNGHYVECVTPISIDIPLLNMIIVGNQDIDEKYTLTNNVNEQELSGRCCIGLRALYSSGLATYGALIPETYDEDDSSGDRYYNGIQIVVLPESQFKTPSDGVDLNNVTAHLKLATFEVRNGVIIGEVEPNPDKVRYIDVRRLVNADTLLSDKYPSIENLSSNNHYVLSPKMTQDGLTLSWCKATENLKDWSTSGFITSGNEVYLQMSPKSIDGRSSQISPTNLRLPVANYYTGSPGIVDSKYTDIIKQLRNEVDMIYSMPGGRHRSYIPVLDKFVDLPTIQSDWEYGDYVVVGRDNSVSSAINTTSPSTMYIILPGSVTQVKPIYTDMNKTKLSTNYTISTRFVPSVSDIEELTSWDKVTTVHISTSEYEDGYVSIDKLNELADKVLAGLNALYSNPDILTKIEVDSTYVEVYSSDLLELDGADAYLGCFLITRADSSAQYSDPIYLTGEIGFATPERVGGFLNFEESDAGAIDNGYVRLNEEGYLQLVDYPLLRSGLLAYQLGQSVKISSGIDAVSIQAELDNYVNRRIAFANSRHIAAAEANGLSGSLQHIIDVYLPLSEEGSGTVDIYEIDSRFNTPVCIHISGKNLSGYTINISDCQRVRILLDAETDPTVNVYRSSIYYDADILNRLNTMSDITLWYHRYILSDRPANDYASTWADEPDLVVDGMTVKFGSTSTLTNKLHRISGNISGLDVHYSAGVQSITFNNSGQVIGVGLYVKNDSGADSSSHITANPLDNSFVLQGIFDLCEYGELDIPLSAFQSDMTVRGECTTSYISNDKRNYIIVKSLFGAIISPTDSEISCKFTIVGEAYSVPVSNVISANIEGNLSSDVDSDALLGFGDNSQIFYGGIV